MNPLIIDGVVAVIAVLLMGSGFRHGFIRAAGSLIGLVVSIAAGIWGVTWLQDLTGLHLTTNPAVFVVVFLILTILVSQVIRLLVGALDLVRRVVSIIPFVGLINSLLGLVLGLVQVAILILAMAYVTVVYLPAGAVKTSMYRSHTVGTGISVSEQLGLF